MTDDPVVDDPVVNGPVADGSGSAIRCDLCDEPIDLGARGILTVRHARAGDERALGLLYDTLDVADLLTRFFTAGRPSESFLEGWVSVADRGGRCLVAELQHRDTRRIVAEAGFASLADGDVELGITVDPAHRGWVGPWLLDQLLSHAAHDGIQNMQALVKTRNRPMLDLIKHRGCARFEEADWETTRVTMSTSGHTPSWPPDSAAPRVLIESPRSRPDVARRVRKQSGTTLICSGFRDARSHCPLHSGDPCPLIAGADAVVLDGLSTPEAADEQRTLQQTIKAVHPDAHLIVVEQDDGLPRRDSMIDLKLPAAPGNEAPTNQLINNESRD